MKDDYFKSLSLEMESLILFIMLFFTCVQNILTMEVKIYGSQ
jgi:hypothetical protein